LLGLETYVPAVKSNNLQPECSKLKFSGPGTAFRLTLTTGHKVNAMKDEDGLYRHQSASEVSYSVGPQWNRKENCHLFCMTIASHKHTHSI